MYRASVAAETDVKYYRVDTVFMGARRCKAMHIEGLDDMDNRILTVLQKEARLSYSEIGERVGLSRVAVKNRMDNLEKNGIIQGYVTVINPTNMPEGRRFFIDIEAEPDKFDQVVENISKYEIVRRVYALTGKCRVLIEGYAPTTMRYEMFMMNLKRLLEGVNAIQIHDVQYKIIDRDEEYNMYREEYYRKQ